MLDLDAIEARAEAATPGPWTARLRDDMWEINDGSGSNFVSIVESCWLPDDCDAGQYGGIPDVDDARFIAHARADIPALVAELRAAREVVEAAPVAITLRTDEAFYGAMNRLADALAAYRAVVGTGPLPCADC